MYYLISITPKAALVMWQLFSPYAINQILYYLERDFMLWLVAPIPKPNHPYKFSGSGKKAEPHDFGLKPTN